MSNSGPVITAPEFWIVAGPNGAGKTTCVQKEPIASLLPNVSFINPDDLTLRKLIDAGYGGFHDAPIDVQTKHFFESADEVQLQLELAIESGKSIGVETVLSTHKYRPLVDRVIAMNGRFYLIYITLLSPKISIERVASRVKRGGHGISEDKIEARFYRSHTNLSWFAIRAHSFWVIDNSDNRLEGAPAMSAYGSCGRVTFLDSAHETIRMALSTLENMVE